MAGPLRRNKKLTDTPFLPFLDDNNNNKVDFEIKRLTKVGTPLTPTDALHSGFLCANRISIIRLTGKLSQSNFFRIRFKLLSVFIPW